MSITNSEISYQLLPEDYSQFDLSFKVIVIGDSFVGKSCLTLKGTKNVYESNYNTTVGFEFCSFNIKFDERIIKLQIWDTCGQEIYRSLVINFYRSCSCAIIVFSIDNKESFLNIPEWIKNLKTYSSPDVKIFLVGSKCDLENERVVNPSDVKTLMDNYDIKHYIETSSKTGFNSQQLFVELAKLLYNDFISYKKRPAVSAYSRSISSVNINNISQSKDSDLVTINNFDNNDKNNKNFKESINIKKKGCC